MKNIAKLSLLIILFSGCQLSSRNTEDVARKIHEKVFTVDSHTDSPWYLLNGGFDLDERHDYKVDGSRLDFPRMKEGGLDAVFMAAFVGQRERSEEGNRNAKEKVMATIDSIRVNLARKTKTSGLALTPADAYRLEKEGKRAVFIGIENGYALGDDLKNIEMFYEKGARYITLCHTKNNDICDSSTDSADFNGLSPFGEEAVKEMIRTGMMIDVSHISDSSFFDVIRLAGDVPVVATHSCARAVCDNPRNLSDDMLKMLAANGGVIQVCVLSDYVKTPEPYPERDSAFDALHEKYGDFHKLSPEMEKKAWQEWEELDAFYTRKLATVSDFAGHIDHIVKIAGIDHVGIGTDFDGGGGLEDCRDVSELGKITLELVRRGYTEKEIRKIWGGNLMRVMDQVQRAGKS